MVILNTSHFEGFDLPQEIKFQSILFIEKVTLHPVSGLKLQLTGLSLSWKNCSKEIVL